MISLVLLPLRTLGEQKIPARCRETYPFCINESC